MPWTFAHPAAVLPLRRFCPSVLNFPALIIGSVIPDFGYYIDWWDLADVAHSLAGSVLICMPAGLVLLIALHVLREPLSFVLPEPHRGVLRQQFAIPATRSISGIASAAVSVLLGAWTHIVWDSFTHTNGWAVVRWEFLRQPALRFAATEVPVYHLLQQLCSIGGVLMLVYAYRLWLSRHAPRRPALPLREERWRYVFLGLIVMTAVAIALPLAARSGAASGHPAWAAFIVRSALYATAAFVAMFTLCSVVCYALRRPRR
jgi:hypothetical protein